MKIRLFCVTHKTPAWVKEGYEEYAKRIPPAYSIELVEIPAEKRTPTANTKRLMEREGEKILGMIKQDELVVALNIKGEKWSTEKLAQQLAEWHQDGRNIALLIGGPEGLAPACLERANVHWSLSPMTFPHFLVKVILAEQLYRAYTILTGHPYHR